MSKLIKPLIVVLLLLSVASLVLGMMLFQRREVLKARALRLEEAAVDTAANLRFEDFNATALRAERPEEIGAMDRPLRQLVEMAGVRYDALRQTESDLSERTSELERERAALVQARRDVEAAQNRATELQQEIETRQTQITRLQSELEEAATATGPLERQIDELQTQLASKQEEARDLMDQVATLEGALERVEQELGIEAGTVALTGLTGEVLRVNRDWNFVILNLGRAQGLVPEAEMLVYRDADLVGKVRISSVKDAMAVAEVLRDWERDAVQEGDHVLY